MCRRQDDDDDGGPRQRASGLRQRRVVDAAEAQRRGALVGDVVIHQTLDVISPAASLGVVDDADVAHGRRHAVD